MMYWIYSAVLPTAIIVFCMAWYRPLTFANITKSLTVSLIPLLIYILLIYFLETEEWINSGWAFLYSFHVLFTLLLSSSVI
jgi:hypothetical protein